MSEGVHVMRLYIPCREVSSPPLTPDERDTLSAGGCVSVLGEMMGGDVFVLNWRGEHIIQCIWEDEGVCRLRRMSTEEILGCLTYDRRL